MTYERKRNAIVSILFIAIIFLLVWLFFSYVLIYALPFLLGILVSVLLQRPIDWLEKRTKVPRVAWSVFLVLVVLTVLLGLVVLIVYRLFVWLSDVAGNFSTYSHYATVAFSGFAEWGRKNLSALDPSVRISILNLPSTVITSLGSKLSVSLTDFATSIIKGAPMLLIDVVVTTVACILITKDYYRIVDFFKRQFNEEHWDILSHTKNLFMQNIIKLVRGYLLIYAVTMVELQIALAILGVPGSFSIAILVSFADFIPVLGTGTVLIPWGAIVLLTTNHIFQGAGLIALYFIILIVRNAIEPKIIGGQVGLPPLVTLCAMYIGLQMFGLAGLIGLPMAVIIINALQRTGKLSLWK